MHLLNMSSNTHLLGHGFHNTAGNTCIFTSTMEELNLHMPCLPLLETHCCSAVVLQAVFNYDLAGLMAKLQDVGERQNYAWIRTRIERMWPSWTAAARRLEQTQNMTGREVKKVGACVQ